MTHLDLFSGIGGFAIASEAVWPDITHTFVENDKFCQQVLRKHWQNATIFGDIRDFIWQLENAPNAESVNAILKSGRGVVNVNRHITESGINEIQRGRKNEEENTDGNFESKSSPIMDNDVSVAGKLQNSSSPLTTKTEVGIKNDEKRGEQTITETSSEQDSQNIYKSYATTATKQSHTTENVPTKNEIHGDIRQFIADTESKGLQRPTSDEELQPARGSGFPFILTGGFPCQPFSQAGRRRGTADDRYLWPQMFRVIQLTQPQWVIAENVRGLVTWNDGMVLEQVCADLESEGYEVQPFIIPAVAVNAPHRRDRIWIVAHSESRGTRSQQSERSIAGKSEEETRNTDSDAQDAIGQRSRGRSQDGRQVLERQSSEVQDQRPSWESNWVEIATELCRVDDGLPTELHIFGGIEYNTKYDGNPQSQDTKTLPTLTQSLWDEMRKVWEWWSAQPTSSTNERKNLHYPLYEMPRFSPQENWLWNVGQTDKGKELRDMWKAVCSSSLQEAQQLFPEMLERVREIERTKTVGELELSKSAHRRERLKSLGNAIVPQVAIEIMKSIAKVKEMGE